MQYRIAFINGKSYTQSWSVAGKSEEDLIDGILFQLTENGCDCQFDANWHRSQNLPDPHVPCGNEWEVDTITLIRPDGSELVIYGEEGK